MKRKILWICGTLLFVLALTLFLFHTSFIKTKILNYINGYLARSLDFSISAESLDYNLFTLRVSFKKLKAVNRDDAAHIPFFQAEAVELRLTPALILGKKMDFKNIHLVKPRVNIRVHSDGTLNIPPQLYRKSEEPLPALHLRHLSIADGHLVYQDSAEGLFVEIPGIDLAGVMITGGKQEFDLDIIGNKNNGKPGQLVYRDKTLYLGEGKIAARLNKRNIFFILNVSRRPTDEAVNIKGRLSWEGPRFSLTELRMAAAGDEITGTGEFYPFREAPLRDIKFKNHLALAWNSLNLQNSFLSEYISHPLHSQTSGSLNFFFPDFTFADYRANVSLTLTALNTPPKKAAYIPLSGHVSLELTPAGLTIRDFDISTPGNRQPGISETHIRGSLYVNNKRFRGEFSGSYKSEPFIYGHLLLNGEMSGQPANPLIRAELQSKGIHVGGMLFKPAGTLEYKNRQFKTQNMKVVVNGIDSGPVVISGIFPLGAPPPGSPDPLDVTIKVKHIDFRQLTLGLQTDIPVNASFSVEVKLLPGRVETDLLLENCVYERKDKSLIDIGNIDARLLLAHNRLTYNILAKGLAVEVSGSGRPEFPYPLQGTVFIAAPNFETLAKRQGFALLEGISGTMQGRLNYRLNLANIRETVKVETVIDKFFMRTRERELENTGPIRFTYDQSGLTVANLELTGPGSAVRCAGFLPMEKVTAGGLILEGQIDSRLLRPFPDSLRLQGNLSIRTRIAGSLAQPLLSAEVILNRLSFTSAGAPLSPELKKGINGLVDGRITIGGNLSNLRELSAEARFPELRIAIPGFSSLSAPQPVKLRLQNGNIRVEQLSLQEENNRSRLDISGSADLTGEQTLALHLTGRAEAKLLNFFLEDLEFAGENNIDIRLGGKLRQPEISGTIEIRDNSWFYPAYNLLLNRLNGTLRITENRLRLESLKGSLNGGTIAIGGEMLFDIRGIREGAFTLSAAGAYLEFPEELFSEISGALHLTVDKTKYLLKGTIDINGAVYKEPINVRTNLFEFLRGKTAVRGKPAEEKAGNFLENLNLDIWLRTTNPVLIDNNMSRSELTADLTLRGTFPQPTLSGRITAKEGGKIYLGDNIYTIENGTITFVNPYSIEPDLLIRARTRVRNYDIALNINGTPQTLSASFTSTPVLSEPNIIALLTTGRTLENAAGSLLNTTGSQALSYISNTFSGKIRQLAKQKMGIDNVRIDGSLIAARDDPGARLTVGQQLTSDLELTLSQSLKDAQNRSWILDYTPFSNFSIQGIKQDKGRYTAALLQEIRFGGKSGTTAKFNPGKKQKAAAVAEIRFDGDTALDGALIRRTLKLRKGKTFDYFKLQKDMERIHSLYRRFAYLRADIQAKQIKDKDKIIIQYTITAGPRIYLDFSGDYLSRRFKRKAARLWADGRFDRQSIKNVVQYIGRHFSQKGYYQIKVVPGAPVKEGDSIHRPFAVHKGPKYGKTLFMFRGNRLISRKRLYRFLKDLKLSGMAFSQPAEVARQLTLYYREQGFLSARVEEPEILFHLPPERVTVTFPVSEGPLFRFANITISGNQVLDDISLLKILCVKKNLVFSSKKMSEAGYEIAAAYAAKGFNDVHVTYRKKVLKQSGMVDLEFRVEEDKRGIIKEIKVLGNSLTHAAVIRREITFKEGDVLDFREINKSRKKLYDLGIFQRVNIEIEDLPYNSPVESKSEKYLRLIIRLQEFRPFQAKTGLQWNTETAFGAVFELNNPNIAGKSHYFNTSLSLDSKETNFKTYYRFPYFLGKKIATEFFVFAGKKAGPSFTENRRGLTLQQQFQPGKGLLLSWNYTWKKTRTADISGVDFSPAGSDSKLNLAYITTAFSFDRRNSLVNPTRGHFFSFSFQHAAAFLGSEAGFSRIFSEYNRYIPIYHFLVAATSVKIGLGKGLGQKNLPGERFYAGGSTTLRGFKENFVGPLDMETGLPSGGEALFIFKQEIRARLHKLISLVLFADLGNVYGRAEDFEIFNLRKSVGFGIRLHTTPLLLRLDWGFKLNRLPDESPSRIYLSIGQAF